MYYSDYLLTTSFEVCYSYFDQCGLFFYHKIDRSGLKRWTHGKGI